MRGIDFLLGSPKTGPTIRSQPTVREADLNQSDYRHYGETYGQELTCIDNPADYAWRNAVLHEPSNDDVKSRKHANDQSQRDSTGLSAEYYPKGYRNSGKNCTADILQSEPCH
jgi:hypothetical protein